MRERKRKESIGEAFKKRTESSLRQTNKKNVSKVQCILNSDIHNGENSVSMDLPDLLGLGLITLLTMSVKM